MSAVQNPRVVALKEDRYLPVYAVPNRWVRLNLTGTCRHCGGSALDVQWPYDMLDRAHPALRATVVCLLCGRPLALLRIGGTP